MFIDEKVLMLRAGKGGDGVALFRREIYVPKGGPDGGDGGNGGSVYVLGKHDLHALTHLGSVDRVIAEDGLKGGHRRSSGRMGHDQIINLPLGTVIEEKNGEEWVQIFEITQENQKELLCKGGSGGWGNWHFKTSVQQAPDRFNYGLPGQEKEVRFVLKLIADIGLVGLPNAGKSTFLSVVSSARPKIANYPFTTLEPQLGVAQIGRGEDQRQVVIADLPGIIEGASSGKGLGLKFLKHLERTGRIIHMIDSSLTSEEMLENYRVIRGEVEKWSTVLGEKPETIILTKIDLILPEELEEKQNYIEKELGVSVFSLSAVTHQGVEQVLNMGL